MEMDLSLIEEDARYRLLTALVIPRPIAWITTRSENGTVNLAPFSFFNLLGNEPPIIAFGASKKAPGILKDTPTNILANGEFVVHIADRSLAEKVQKSAARLAYGESEASALGLETVPSSKIETPRLKDANVALECVFEQTVKIGDNEVYFGRVLWLHAPDAWFEGEARVRPGAPEAIGRLQGPGWYCTTRDQFDLGRMPSARDFDGK